MRKSKLKNQRENKKNCLRGHISCLFLLNTESLLKHCQGNIQLQTSNLQSCLSVNYNSYKYTRTHTSVHRCVYLCVCVIMYIFCTGELRKITINIHYFTIYSLVNVLTLSNWQIPQGLAQNDSSAGVIEELGVKCLKGETVKVIQVYNIDDQEHTQSSYI